MSKLARVIAAQEGFGIKGAIPTLRHNPGDLRHSPHSSHPGDANAIGTIGTDEEGWADLERQLGLYAKAKWTLRQMVMAYAPPADGNDTQAYLARVCAKMGLGPETLVAVALEVG